MRHAIKVKVTCVGNVVKELRNGDKLADIWEKIRRFEKIRPTKML